MKAIAILLLLCSFSYASIEDIEQLYHQKEYAKVITKAKKRYSQYNNPKLHLLWAKSAEALGEGEMAMSAYERILMIEPDNVEIRVHLAILYHQLGCKELTKKMSKSTQNYQLTPAQRNTLNRLLENDTKYFTATVGIAGGYDSNINVSSEDITLPQDEGAITTPFVRLNASASYQKRVVENENIYFRSDSYIFHQNNTKAHLYNVTTFGINMGIGYSQKTYDFFLPLEYSSLHYLQKDFMQTFAFAPKINLILNQNYILNFNLAYRQRGYIQREDAKRDDSVGSIGTGLYYLFDNNFAYLSAKYQDFGAKNSDSTLYTNKTTTHLKMGINYHVGELFITRADFRYKKANYDDLVVDEAFKREDSYKEFSLSLSRMVTPLLELGINYTYSTNDSNYALVRFNKENSMLGLKYNF